jgi:hypothetical protein
VKSGGKYVGMICGIKLLYKLAETLIMPYLASQDARMTYYRNSVSHAPGDTHQEFTEATNALDYHTIDSQPKWPNWDITVFDTSIV